MQLLLQFYILFASLLCHCSFSLKLPQFLQKKMPQIAAVCLQICIQTSMPLPASAGGWLPEYIPQTIWVTDRTRIHAIKNSFSIRNWWIQLSSTEFTVSHNLSHPVFSFRFVDRVFSQVNVFSWNISDDCILDKCCLLEETICWFNVDTYN